VRDAGGILTQSICQAALANYMVVYGTSDHGIDGNRLFFRDSDIRLREIPDGTSRTLALGERSQNSGQAIWVDCFLNAVRFPVDKDSLGYPHSEDAPSMILGYAGGRVGPGNLGDEVNQSFSSQSGGVNFLFADGPVSLLNTSLTNTTFRALAAQAGARSFRKTIEMRKLPLPLLFFLLALGCDNEPTSDQMVPLDQVPSNVMEAARKALPSYTFDSAGKIEFDGKDTFEVRGKHQKGKVREIEVWGSGKVSWASSEAPLNSLVIPRVSTRLDIHALIVCPVEITRSTGLTS
jgi:hypothetical protein